MSLPDTIDPTAKKKPDSREITKRIIIIGELELLSPTHLGNGDAEGLTDLPLLADDGSEHLLPLLTGASIAGALRNYVRVHEKGFYNAEEPHERNSLAVRLFGMVKGDTDDQTKQSDQGGEQSKLIVDDARGKLPISPEIRDGVRIDGATRTAEDKFKYDLELLPAGTTFPLCFELLIGAQDDEAQLKQALALALHGLESGAISIGARKSRGFGRCVVREWTATTYSLCNSHADLLAWLAADHAEWGFRLADDAIRVGKATDVLIALPEDSGKRHVFTITADFALESPLLIRSEDPLTDDDNQPDFAHMRDSNGRSIIPGTSLAGALRARATRILNTVRPDISQNMIDSLFGKDMLRDSHNPTTSRLIVEEVLITGGEMLVQNRVAIDRFTGGALDTALFAEAPQVGGDVALALTIYDHPDLKPEQRDAEKGLLLLLLKDLWTGDAALGGTGSIGRGRLRGIRAEISDQNGAGQQHWTIEQVGEALKVTGNQQALEAFVTVVRGGEHD
jgi:CRISPR/Cas system CSM-associated protein Csm3 (group 7 of RAMP superfamily)